MKLYETRKEQILFDMHQEGNKLTAITYNVFGGDYTAFKNERKNAIVEEIVTFGNLAGHLDSHEATLPDIICLQEVTLEIVDMLMKKLQSLNSNVPFHLFTPLDCLSIKQNIQEKGQENNKTKEEIITDQECIPVSVEQINDIIQNGFPAILSKFRFKERKLLHLAPYVETPTLLKPTLLKCVLDISSLKLHQQSSEEPEALLTVYNYHATGGSHGKSQEVVLKKQKKRIEELDMLTKDIETDIYNWKSRNINKRSTGEYKSLLFGDFNSDGNDLVSYPEVKEYPENKLIRQQNVSCIDIWSYLRPDELGATESYTMNKLRAYLKPNQNREAKFDKIVLCTTESEIAEETKEKKEFRLVPKEITLIGTTQVGLIEDQNDNEVELFPSDHFGLVAQFEIQ